VRLFLAPSVACAGAYLTSPIQLQVVLTGPCRQWRRLVQCLLPCASGRTGESDMVVLCHHRSLLLRQRPWRPIRRHQLAHAKFHPQVPLVVQGVVDLWAPDTVSRIDAITHTTYVPHGLLTFSTSVASALPGSRRLLKKTSLGRFQLGFLPAFPRSRLTRTWCWCQPARRMSGGRLRIAVSVVFCL
jgi:hypothetical protein